MIRNSVVLVLGAGASQPYDFPSGAALKREAQALDARNDTEFRQTFLHSGVDIEEFDRFSKALARSPVGSVDAFLEARRDFVDIGKHVIAYLLIKRENPKALGDISPKDNENWYRYLFQLMTTEGLGGFKENNLQIITYNYDRSFEYFFLNALMSTYGLNFQYAQEQLSHIRIIHVHGQLGMLAEAAAPNFSRTYNSDTSAEQVRTAADGIRIVHELEGESGAWEGFEQAWGALHKARTIIFLGFGYGPENIQRLLRGAEQGREDNRLFGTTYGKTDSEIRTLIQPEIAKFNLQLVQTTASNGKVLEYIQNNLELFVNDGGNKS